MAEEISGGAGADARRRKRRIRFLAEELQEEILLRLPIQSVIRFESVCKTWLFMFRSRGFTDLYDGRRRPGGYSSCCHSLELHTISFADLWKIVPGLADTTKSSTPKLEKCCGTCRVFRLLGPLSNGIYCVTCHRQDLSTGHSSILTGKIALFNPATRDCKFTNPFPRRFHSTLSNISSKPCSLHLGFGKVKVQKNKNNSSEDYRVVVLITYGSEQNLSLFILAYSVQRGVWKKLVDYEPGKRNVGPRKATQAFNNIIRITHIYNPLQVCPQRFFEGCYHWMAEGEDGLCYVLAFDFADESFQVTGGPPPDLVLDLDDETVYIMADVFVLHGRLAAIYLTSVSSSNGDEVRRYVEVSVWTMMEYGVEESWTRIYTIHPNFDGQIRRLYGIHYSPLKNKSGAGAGAGAGISIEKLFFKDWLRQQTISCDDAGYQVSSVYESESELCWNTPGISTYIQTLERL